MYDVIVLGLGGFGSSAAYHAARHGANVLGLEQFTPAHDRGSSHGETRIIRQAYLEHPDYVPLAIRAYDFWQNLERESGRTLLTQQGLLISGTADSDAVAGTKFAAAKHQLPLEELSHDEVQRRFTPFRFPAEHQAVFETNGGYLTVEDCVRSHLELAERHGAELRFDSPIVSWTSDGRTATVRTKRDEFTAKRLIIAAGAWASRCLADLDVPLRVVRKFVGWFRVRPEFAEQARAIPCFCFEINSRFFYGFPSLDGETIKVAEHTGGQPVDDPSQVDRSCTDADVAPLAGFIRDCLPFAEPALVRHSVCLYTLTPDHHFIVDRHPQHENVVVACGFSGHGFKFTSVLGDALAELALGGKTDAPIGFLGLNRPGVRP
jgi:monomeric sarcosine oxidase